jgi:uncharacterized protein YjbI with pentapeptide repeats
LKATLRIAAVFSIAAGGLAAGTFGLPAHAADCNKSAEAGIDWHDCRKRNLILEGSDLSSAKLSDADFSSTDLRGTNLTSADFTKAALARAMLDNSTAENAIFEKALGYRTSFVKANLAGANFAKSEMHRADFENAILINADFDKSELGRVDFSGAQIDNTHFRFSNLARADFRTAIFSTPIDFSGSFLYLTRFEGVDLSQATGLLQWQVDMLCGDDDTLLPEGLAPNEAWPCGEEE